MAITKVSRDLLNTSIVDNGNATAITIDSSENVGIGTSSPSAKLHTESGVARTSTAKTETAFFSSTDADDFRFGLAVSHKGGATDADRYASLDSTAYRISTDTFAAGGSLVLQELGGNVGIGTTSPARVLHTTDDLVRFDNSGTAGIMLLDTLNNEGFRILTNKDSGAFSIEDMGTATTGAGTERLRIDSSGSVGIGTTSPASVLDVRGARSDLLRLYNTVAGGDAELEFITLNNASSVGKLSKITATQVGADTNGSILAFSTSPTSSNTPAERMRIDSSGNVSFTTSGGIIKSIGGDVSLVQGAIGLRINDAGSALSPTTASANSDAAVDLGVSNIRFKDLYLSGGVYLGGTGAANQLDDYEEGTFTLVLSGDTTAGTQSGGSSGGKYTKIGRVVTCSVVIANTTLSGAAGTLLLTGFPFVPANYADRPAIGVLRTYQQDLASPSDGYFSPVLTINHNSNSGVIVQTKDNGTWSVVQVENTGGLYFEGTVTYVTS
jgi:hypothetical protein